jgi:NADH pyrophosphatase NudC (nudix superfamily)
MIFGFSAARVLQNALRVADEMKSSNEGSKENRQSESVDFATTEMCLAPQIGEYWRWCPRCGHELHNEKCKLRCPRCHYFMSCSDFD